MSAADATSPELTPDERAEIRRRFAKALLDLGLGILLPLIYFWALIAWLVSGLDHAASSKTISLTFGIDLYLLLGGMADCLNLSLLLSASRDVSRSPRRSSVVATHTAQPKLAAKVRRGRPKGRVRQPPIAIATRQH